MHCQIFYLSLHQQKRKDMKLLELYTSSEYSNSDEPIVINTDNIVSIKPIDAFICVFVCNKDTSCYESRNNIYRILKTYSDCSYTSNDDSEIEVFEFYKDESGMFCNAVTEVEEYFNEHPLYEKETYAYKIHYLITLTNNERYVVSDEFYENNFKKRVKSIKQ